MIAKTGKSIKELLEDLFRRVGPRYTIREDVTVTDTMRETLDKTMKHPPTSFAGKSVNTVNQLDGCKLLLSDGSWFLIRPSGTEPIVRCYAEASTPDQLQNLLSAGRELLHVHHENGDPRPQSQNP